MGLSLHGTPYIYIMVKKLSDRNRYSYERWGIIFEITGRDLDLVRRFQVVMRENKATGLVSGSASRNSLSLGVVSVKAGRLSLSL
jgi:hypothetical protein